MYVFLPFVKARTYISCNILKNFYLVFVYLNGFIEKLITKDAIIIKEISSKQKAIIFLSM